MGRIDLTNKRFERLVVLGYSHTKGGRLFWHCKCDCGNTCIANGHDLKDGRIKSCGCYNMDRITKHNMSRTRFYRIWMYMRGRCNNCNYVQYKYYGGRGITVCDKWSSFENFKDDMYESYLSHVKEFGEKNTSLDRINPNGNYEPNNCRWATNSEQQANTRRKRMVSVFGEIMTLKQASEKYNINYNTVVGRLWRGKDIFGNPT